MTTATLAATGTPAPPTAATGAAPAALSPLAPSARSLVLAIAAFLTLGPVDLDGLDVADPAAAGWRRAPRSGSSAYRDVFDQVRHGAADLEHRAGHRR